ncbi:MAG: tetratricopeptide repeat protein [Rubripirellula sp.]|nr:tetratricopeptide repeat protein [Rubripirellula sp.]
MSKRKRRPSQATDNSHHRETVMQPVAITTRKKSFKMLLGSICLVAFFLRLLNLLQTFELPTVVQLMGDARGYVDWAEQIASGEWYGTQTFYQAPLYPYTLAVLIKGFSAGTFGLRFFQIILGTISVGLIGIAGRHAYNRQVGVIAAAMYALYPPAIYYDGIIQKTALASFLLCLLLAECSYLNRRASKVHSLFAGITLGLLVLTRENALLWVPVIPIWMALRIPAERVAKTGTLISYAMGLAVVLLPVAARNASLGGEWSPTTFQAGPNFYIGNNVNSNGLYRPLVPGHETPKYERADAQRLAEQDEGRELTSREVSRYWFEKSFTEIKQDPGRWFRLLMIKSLMVVNRFEVPDVESMRVYRDFSITLSVLAPVWNFGILCPLAIWGVLVTKNRWRRLSLFYAFTLVMVAAIIGFFILGRYREPLVPLLILFAAGGMPVLIKVLRTRDWASFRFPIAVTIFSIVACNLPVHDESMLNASSYMNAGVAAGMNGDLRVSIEYLLNAIDAEPGLAEAYANLGRAYEQSNEPQKAIHCYQQALVVNPMLQPVDTWMGSLFESMDARSEALESYQRALEKNPMDEAAQQAIQRLGDKQTP